jgi:hypothetical protein
MIKRKAPRRSSHRAPKKRALEQSVRQIVNLKVIQLLMSEIAKSENIDGDQGIYSGLQSGASLYDLTDYPGSPKNRTIAKDVTETTASSRGEEEAIAHRKKNIQPSQRSYRVRGIPLNYNLHKTESLLQRVLRLENDNSGLKVKSLAIDSNKRAKVATINFEDIPGSLLVGHEWTFDITDLLVSTGEDDDVIIPRTQQITIDDHFLGLTTLYSPSSIDHKVE